MKASSEVQRVWSGRRIRSPFQCRIAGGRIRACPSIDELVTVQGETVARDEDDAFWTFPEKLLGDLEVLHADGVFAEGEAILGEKCLDLAEPIFDCIRIMYTSTDFESW
ncbi:MAG: hypothetical protein AAGH40_00060 [Verrucomicrobiota bacterium]